MELFSERLRQLRNDAGLKQEDAAEKMGIPYRSYRRYESGESSPTVPILIRIADYFQVSLDYLTGRCNER